MAVRRPRSELRSTCVRPVDNPRQRFERQYVEWLDEPPPARLEVFEETATRDILAENDSPDVGFRWSVNPYRGCTHACAYCYARPSHEYLGLGAGTDFETKVMVKVEAPRLLREALARRGWMFERIAFSGDTDCYQPLEAHYGLTRACLEACRDVANPVLIITKSHLVARDVDVIAELARRASVTVGFSIAFADDELARKIEPGAPRPSKRFEAMRVLSDAGVRTGVLFAPIIPGLNEDAIPAVLERARDAGARFASRILLRLPHSVKEVFLSRVAEQLPDRAKRIEHRIREVRGGALSDPRFGERHRGKGTYWESIDSLFRIHALRLGFPEIEDEDHAKPPPPRPGEQLDLF